MKTINIMFKRSFTLQIQKTVRLYKFRNILFYFLLIVILENNSTEVDNSQINLFDELIQLAYKFHIPELIWLLLLIMA